MSNFSNATPLLSAPGKVKPYTFGLTTSKYQSIDFQRKSNKTDDKKILLDLLIEGYIRTECHLRTDYLFPIDIKQMIASYYIFNLRAYIKSKQEIKKLQIATKLQTEKCETYWRLSFNKNIHALLFLVWLITSIAAVIIVCIAYYNEYNHCKDNYSIIDPTTFTLIAGVLCLSHALYIGLYRVIALLYFHGKGKQINNPHQMLLTIDLTAYLNEIQKRHKWLYLGDIISKWIMLIFYIVWSIIGFYIFQNEMSHHCIHSNIGKTMISWSVIMFILAAYYYASNSLPFIVTVLTETAEDDDDYTMVLKQKVASKKKLFCLFVPLFTISIFLFIISQSKYIFCNGNYSMLKPTYFTIIGGSVAMLHLVFIFVLTVFVVESNHFDIAGIMSWILCIFYFVWSILGFYIYHNQLSSDCVETMFATLFIIWSVLAFTISFIYHINFAWTTFPDEYELRIKIFSEVICTYPFLFLSIAVTIVAIYGDETICNTDYNPNWRNDFGITGFALIAGIVSSMHFIITLLTLYAKFFHYVYGVCDSAVTFFFGDGCSLVFLVMMAFYFTWGIMGFVMYDIGMSPECQQDIVGQMIMAWCVIMFIIQPCYTISLVLFLNEGCTVYRF